MLSHIKDLFRQRKERQQKRFFNNHFNKPEPISEIKVRSTIKKIPSTPVKKIKELSTDNMTIIGNDDDDSKINAADELANLLAEQDNKRRSQLPTYPGLERFEITKKLGEYCICLLFIFISF